MLAGLDLPAAGGGTEAGVQSTHWGNCLKQRRNIYEDETADLRQPKCNENQTVLAAAIHTPDRDAGPLEGAAAVSWEHRDCGAIPGHGLLLTADRWTEGMCGRRSWWETPVKESQAARQPWKQGNTTESCVGGRDIIIASLSLQPHQQMNNREMNIKRLTHQN